MPAYPVPAVLCSLLLKNYARPKKLESLEIHSSNLSHIALRIC
uniref:Uncharacterized protein n=1 Tax=Rhizophora mucronata TaxID=61149 RepID=A0A2P2QNU6_RHIMU